MPRYAQMLKEGMIARGHDVAVLSPEPYFYTLPVPFMLKKWLGYIDQFLLFPTQVQRLLKKYSADTLFVFTDHALGPWIPMVAKRPHVIHCHDFLAQRSAQHEFKENRIGWTGQVYQGIIRRGYVCGRNFISVSEKTKEDLHHFLPFKPSLSTVVYNGLNQLFKPIEPICAREMLSVKYQLSLDSGYMLHVGGNQWYKNRRGVIEIYDAWRALTAIKIPLLLIGQSPSAGLCRRIKSSPYSADIHVLSSVSDEFIRIAYAGASVFLYPSIAEGFGWPIAEAMASGCPVITTNEAPMTEVAGSAGFFIPRRPSDILEAKEWAIEAARVVEKVLSFTSAEHKLVVEAGIKNARRFDMDIALNRIESIYKNILSHSC